MAVWSPKYITTDLWLDADDSSTITEVSGSVSLWEDKSGNGNDLSQGTSANQPITDSVTIGGVNALSFDGVNDNLIRLSPVVPATDSTVFVLVRYNSVAVTNASIITTDNATAAPRFYLQIDSSIVRIYGGSYTNIANISVADEDLLAIERSGSVFNVWRNGTQVVNNATAGIATINTSFSIGRMLSFGVASSVDVGETLIVDGVMLQSSRQKVEGYLAHKWGLEANLPGGHPYKASAPTIDLWTPSQISTDLWLDADDEATITESAGAVSQWDDKSGNNNHVSQSVGSLQPGTGSNTMNGLNTIAFNSDLLKLDSGSKSAFKYLHDGTGGTIFAVCEVTVANLNNFSYLVHNNNGSSVNVGFLIGYDDRASQSDNDAYVVIITKGVSGQSPVVDETANGLFPAQSPIILSFENSTARNPDYAGYTNGTDSVNGNYAFSVSTANSTLELHIGFNSGGTLPFIGNMSEIMIFDSVLSDADRQMVEGYLAWKWGTQSSLSADHRYKAYPPINNAWTPSEATTDLWFDADDAATITESGGLVSQWDDKSGNNNDATQTTGSSQPLTNSVTIQSRNALDFDGSNDYFNLTSSITLTNDMTVISIFNRATTGIRSIMMGNEAVGDARYSLWWETDNVIYTKTESGFESHGSNTLTGDIVAATVRDASNIRVDIDGATGSNVAAAAPTLSYTDLCATSTAGVLHNGSLGEIILINSLVSQDLLDQLTGYLAWKWGAQGKLPATHPYSTEPPVVDSGAVISANLVEEGDGLVASIQVPSVLTANIIEEGDLTNSTISVPASVSASINEEGDAVLATIITPVKIAANVNEEGDTTFAVIGNASILSANQTEEGDLLSASLETTVVLDANIMEEGDATLAAIGNISFLNALVNEAGDVQSAIISSPSQLSANVNEEGDDLVGVLLRSIEVSANVDEDGDTTFAVIKNASAPPDDSTRKTIRMTMRTTIRKTVRG